MLETLFEGDWWESVVVDVDTDRVLLHYVGGEEEEDEWILTGSSRLRPPQSEAEPAEPSGLRADVVEPAAARPSDHAANMESDSSAQRPMRRSRMLSDDARLALQLQEEELKAVRGNYAVARKRSKSSPRKDPPKQRKVETSKPPTQSQPPAQNRRFASLKADPAQSSASRPVAPRAGGSTSKASSAAHSASSKVRSAPAPGSRKQPTGKEAATANQEASRDSGNGCDMPGMVALRLMPDETVPKSAPRLKRSALQLKEDDTVMVIKQRVHDEVFPDVAASDIEIRTQNKILCGQDHSLKYVRTFLWPRSKGDLLLVYSKAKESLL